ncbi:hypothetical protein GCM10023176_16130 [Micromonospora coerulea]|uniref:Uncharacterized protein n=1 Tax=Micromonospora coerulea TaxID=47856 RepID=A0ABP8SD38_9ACTN
MPWLVKAAARIGTVSARSSAAGAGTVVLLSEPLSSPAATQPTTTAPIVSQMPQATAFEAVFPGRFAAVAIS